MVPKLHYRLNEFADRVLRDAAEHHNELQMPEHLKERVVETLQNAISQLSEEDLQFLLVPLDPDIELTCTEPQASHTFKGSQVACACSAVYCTRHRSRGGRCPRCGRTP